MTSYPPKRDLRARMTTSVRPSTCAGCHMRDNVRPLSNRGGARATLDGRCSIPPPSSAPAAVMRRLDGRALIRRVAAFRTSRWRTAQVVAAYETQTCGSAMTQTRPTAVRHRDGKRDDQTRQPKRQPDGSMRRDAAASRIDTRSHVAKPHRRDFFSLVHRGPPNEG